VLIVKKLELVHIFQKGLVSSKKLVMRFVMLMYDSESEDQFTEVVIIIRG